MPSAVADVNQSRLNIVAFHLPISRIFYTDEKRSKKTFPIPTNKTGTCQYQWDIGIGANQIGEWAHLAFLYSIVALPFDRRSCLAPIRRSQQDSLVGICGFIYMYSFPWSWHCSIYCTVSPIVQMEPNPFRRHHFRKSWKTSWQSGKIWKRRKSEKLIFFLYLRSSLRTPQNIILSLSVKKPKRI